jgi:biopolymer transport protein TolR
MGMSIGTAGRGGRGHRRRGRHHGLISEINVTPFVDVMLVLLTVGVPIDLPETRANAMNPETQPITISVNENGQIYLQETEIPLDEVVAKLNAIATTGYEERIYVRGDKTTNYGTVMQVMARIQAAGYTKIGLVTLQEQDDT